MQRKCHLCIPFLGIERPQFQFPLSCVCERLYIPFIGPYISCSSIGRSIVGIVERPDPKGLSTLVSAPSSCRTGDLNSCPPDLELGALTKWLASRC